MVYRCRLIVKTLFAMILFSSFSHSIAASNEEKVQKMYVAYYGRPGDPEGLDWWAGKLAEANGDLTEIIESFGNSDEFVNRFGSFSNSELINNIYVQLFGRSADAGGLAWYVGKLESGDPDWSLASIALRIVDGVNEGTDDATIVDNRMTVANSFTLAVENGTKTYAGSNDVASAVDMLARISSDFRTKEWALASFDKEFELFFPPEGMITVCSYDEPIGNLTDYSCNFKSFSSYGHGDLTDFQVTNSTLFVDPDSRRSELSMLNQSEIDALCDATYPIDYETFSLVPPESSFEEGGAIHFPLVIATAHFNYLGNGDAARMILRLLSDWAEAEVNLDDEFGVGNGAHYQVGLFLPVYIRAWNSIRYETFVSDSDRSLVDSYLKSVTARMRISDAFYSGSNYPASVDFGNHSWSQFVGVMAYSIFSDDDIYFQQSIAHYFAVLDGLVRADGSLIPETQRGGSSLYYSLYSTSLLIRLAELAANQGYDIYAIEINGVSLHNIMEFHISALEDNDLFLPYTSHLEGINDSSFCETEEQCLNWNNQVYGENNTGGYNYGGWAEFDVYRKRFPDSSLVGRYLAIFPDSEYYNIAEGPFVQSCEYRIPDS